MSAPSTFYIDNTTHVYVGSNTQTEVHRVTIPAGTFLGNSKMEIDSWFSRDGGPGVAASTGRVYLAAFGDPFTSGIQVGTCTIGTGNNSHNTGKTIMRNNAAGNAQKGYGGTTNLPYTATAAAIVRPGFDTVNNDIDVIYTVQHANSTDSAQLESTDITIFS